jgi:hypothetical protein
MNDSDQDIDTAGTEADDDFRQRHEHERDAGHDVTTGPLGIPPDEAETPRGSDPGTLHRAEDDDVAFERSPEFHDQPASGREAGVKHDR